jgi:hypothetical protein
MHNGGGYKSPRSLGISCFIAFIITVISLPAPYLTKFVNLGTILWLLLFLIGFILPVVSGLLL